MRIHRNSREIILQPHSLGDSGPFNFSLSEKETAIILRDSQLRIWFTLEIISFRKKSRTPAKHPKRRLSRKSLPGFLPIGFRVVRTTKIILPRWRGIIKRCIPPLMWIEFRTHFRTRQDTHACKQHQKPHHNHLYSFHILSTPVRSGIRNPEASSLIFVQLLQLVLHPGYIGQDLILYIRRGVLFKQIHKNLKGGFQQRLFF